MAWALPITTNSQPLIVTVVSEQVILMAQRVQTLCTRLAFEDESLSDADKRMIASDADFERAVTQLPPCPAQIEMRTARKALQCLQLYPAADRPGHALLAQLSEAEVRKLGGAATYHLDSALDFMGATLRVQ